jgi:hypothetical protein
VLTAHDSRTVAPRTRNMTGWEAQPRSRTTGSAAAVSDCAFATRSRSVAPRRRLESFLPRASSGAPLRRIPHRAAGVRPVAPSETINGAIWGRRRGSSSTKSTNPPSLTPLSILHRSHRHARAASSSIGRERGGCSAREASARSTARTARSGYQAKMTASRASSQASPRRPACCISRGGGVRRRGSGRQPYPRARVRGRASRAPAFREGSGPACDGGVIAIA